MPLHPASNDRFYRLIVRIGLFLRWALQLDIRAAGLEHLPAAPPPAGPSRQVAPGGGAVFGAGVAAHVLALNASDAPRRPDLAVDGLTAREREVLALLADFAIRGEAAE